MKSMRDVSFFGQSGVGQDVAGVLEQLQPWKNSVALDVDGHRLLLTKLDRVYWPGEGKSKPVTKGDYIRYLATLSPVILQHLKHRPITLACCPQGATGEWYFQRHWKGQLPPFVETVAVYSERSHYDRLYLMCNNLATLLWLGEKTNLELHAWFSRLEVEPDARGLPRTFTASIARLNRSVLNYPDFLTFDLDPFFYSTSEPDGRGSDRIALRKCCDLAIRLKEILEALSLSPYVKTSGKAGLHIFVPILRNMDYPHVKSAAAAVAWLLLQDHPQDVTTEWTVARRTGKVFLDYNQNARGKTLPWVYSPEADPEATISMPVGWDELEEVDPAGFTMDTACDRLGAVGDLWGSILEGKADLSHLYSPAV